MVNTREIGCAINAIFNYCAYEDNKNINFKFTDEQNKFYNQLPDCIKRIINEYWPLDDLDIGGNILIGKFNLFKSSDFLQIFSEHYLPIACGCNGDPVVLNLENYRVYFIDHDSWFPETKLISIIYEYNDLLTYFKEAINDYNLPVDASAVKAINSGK